MNAAARKRVFQYNYQNLEMSAGSLVKGSFLHQKDAAQSRPGYVLSISGRTNDLYFCFQFTFNFLEK